MTIATRSPTTNTGSAWTNPTYAYDDGGAGAATITSAKPAGNNVWGTYGFSLTGSTITQVRVRYDALTGGNEQIRIDVSWDGGASWSAQQVTQLTDTEATYWYDVTAETAWTPEKLADGQLQVRADAYSVGGAGSVSLDWLPVEVTYSSGTTHLGAVALSGVGTLAGIGVSILTGLVTLTGAGTLAAIGRRVVTGLATLSGTGLLSAIGAVYKLGAATLSGAGTLVTTAVATLAGKTTLSGTGNLVGIGRGVFVGASTLTGAGTLSAIGRNLLTGAVTLTGIGNLSTIGRRLVTGVTTLAGIGSLAANGVRIFVGKATLAGVGTLAAIGAIVGGGTIHYGSTILSGIGTLVVVAVKKYRVSGHVVRSYAEDTTHGDVWV